MTIDEAITRLKDLSYATVPPTAAEYKLAIKLGIEALECIKVARASNARLVDPLLEGEEEIINMLGTKPDPNESADLDTEQAMLLDLLEKLYLILAERIKAKPKYMEFNREQIEAMDDAYYKFKGVIEETI